MNKTNMLVGLIGALTFACGSSDITISIDEANCSSSQSDAETNPPSYDASTDVIILDAAPDVFIDADVADSAIDADAGFVFGRTCNPLTDLCSEVPGAHGVCFNEHSPTQDMYSRCTFFCDRNAFVIDLELSQKCLVYGGVCRFVGTGRPTCSL